MRFRAVFVIAVFCILCSSATLWAEGYEISGTVSVKGAPPKPRVLTVTANQDICHRTVPDEMYVISKNKGVRFAVVSVDGISGKGSLTTIRLDNNSCRFVPHVQAVFVGSSLNITNSDPILHNVHLHMQGRTVINVALPVEGLRITKQGIFGEPGVIEVSCSVHKWMKAYVLVFDHPYFAVTDESGKFSIQNVPPGKYSVKVWHEGFGTQTKEITVKDGSRASVNFVYSK